MIALEDKLRTYQKEAVEFMLRQPRCLEYDDMGLGKCLTSISAIETVYNPNIPFTVLIVCTKKGLYVWEEEITKWTGKKSIVYHGTPSKRKKAWDRFICDCEVDYLITTYGMLDEVMERTSIAVSKTGKFDQNWNMLVADEIHEVGLFNHKCPTYEKFEKHARKIQFLYLLTGTPIRKGCIDLYGPLHLVDRYKFSNYWGFVKRYCITIDTPFGKSIERRPLHPEEFRKMLSNYMIRRTKDQVLTELPGKQRQPLYIEMNDKQQQWYEQMLAEMFIVEGDNLIMAPNQMTVLMRLKQLLACPKMLGLDDYGAALDTIAEMGESIIDNGEPFVVFTPFKQAIPFIKERLSKQIKDLTFYVISGGLTAEQFAEQWKGFLYSKNTRKVEICVIKSSASFNAYVASKCFFLGYEEDFTLNAQAEDRLRRGGQKNFVMCYYPMHKGTVDEDVARRLNDKQEASDWIVGNEEIFTALKRRYKMLLPPDKK